MPKSMPVKCSTIVGKAIANTRRAQAWAILAVRDTIHGASASPAPASRKHNAAFAFMETSPGSTVFKA